MLQHGKNTCFCFIEQNLSLIRCSILRICLSVLLDKNVPDMLEHSENTCFMFLLYITKISPISCICTFCWTITVSILYCSMYNEITKFCSIGHKTHGVLQHREDIYLCLMGQKIMLLQLILNTTEMIKSKHPSDVTIRRMNDRIAIYEKIKENNVILHTTRTY